MNTTCLYYESLGYRCIASLLAKLVVGLLHPYKYLIIHETPYTDSSVTAQ